MDGHLSWLVIVTASYANMKRRYSSCSSCRGVTSQSELDYSETSSTETQEQEQNPSNMLFFKYIEEFLKTIIYTEVEDSAAQLVSSPK